MCKIWSIWTSERLSVGSIQWHFNDKIHNLETQQYETKEIRAVTKKFCLFFRLQTSTLLDHSLSHPYFNCLYNHWTFTKTCGNLSSINHPEISCDDSFDVSQDKKHDRQHYKEWALWFQLELEVVKLVKSPRERKNQRRQKSSSDVLAVLVHIKSNRERKQ